MCVIVDSALHYEIYFSNICVYSQLFMDNEEVNEPVPTTLSYEEPLLSAKSPHERVETSLQVKKHTC